MCNARKHEAGGARSLCFSLFLLTAVSSFIHAAETEVREVPLVNPGFESNVLHEGWSLHVYGAPPTLAQDAAVRHEGRMSVFRKRRRSLSERRRSRSGVKKSPNRWCPVCLGRSCLHQFMDGKQPVDQPVPDRQLADVAGRRTAVCQRSPGLQRKFHQARLDYLLKVLRRARGTCAILS